MDLTSTVGCIIWMLCNMLSSKSAIILFLYFDLIFISQLAHSSDVKAPEIFGKISPVNYIVKVAQWQRVLQTGLVVSLLVSQCSTSKCGALLVSFFLIKQKGVGLSLIVRFSHRNPWEKIFVVRHAKKYSLADRSSNFCSLQDTT